MVTHMHYHEYQNVDVQFDAYVADFSPAIRLVDNDSGSPILTATVWLPNLGPNEVAIKNYSENRGVRDWLIVHGVIHPISNRIVQVNHTYIHVHSLTPVAIDRYQRVATRYMS